MSQRYPSRVIGAVLLLSGVIGAVSAASTTSLQPVTREMLCVTEGALAELPDQRFSVSVPNMRAFVPHQTRRAAEARFEYLGRTAKVVPLGSGEVREQFRLKLRAADACKLVYAMWRFKPTASRGLRAAGIPVEWLNEDKWRRHFDPTQDSVKIVTVHSSKGLEFPIVAIPGLGFMPREPDDAREEARLLYVAMTRAMDELLLTCDRQSEFVAKLAQARARLAA